MAKLATVQKRAAPDTTGTKGAFLESLPGDIQFGRKGPVSPYDSLLLKLQSACEQARPSGSAAPGLVFDSARAQQSIYARAKKLGLRVSLAVVNGKLYVRYDGRIGDDDKSKRREAILAVLEK